MVAKVGQEIDAAKTYFTDGKANRHLIAQNLDDIRHPYRFGMTAVAHHIEFVPVDHLEFGSAAL
jgi:hypothetical protein